jgi:hypothetical protein
MRSEMFADNHHADEKCKRIWIPQRKWLFEADRVGGEYAKVIHRKIEF